MFVQERDQYGKEAEGWQRVFFEGEVLKEREEKRDKNSHLGNQFYAMVNLM